MATGKDSTELPSCTMKDSLILSLSRDPSTELNIRKDLSFYIMNILRLALPNTIAAASWTMQTFITLYFVGQMENVKIFDAVALAYTWASVCGFSVIFGFASALDTFVSQSFGSCDYKSCGLIFNKSFAIVSLILIPCILLQWVSGFAFRFIGIDEELSMYAGNFTIALIPSIVLYMPHIILEKFLLAQRITKPQMVFQFLNTLLHPLYCQLFIFWLDLGLYGAAVVRTLSESLFIPALVIYMKVSKCCDKTLVAPSMSMFKEWNSFLAIAFPSLFMTCLEWWAFEIMNLMTGKLGVVDLASNIISFNYSSFIFMTCLGIAIATGTLVGNSIGEDNITNAKMYVKVGTMFSLLTAVTLGTITLLFKTFFAKVFTKDEEVVAILEYLLYLMVLGIAFDSIQCSLAKALIAMGKQAYASYVNLISYYVLMLPVGIISGFVLGWRVYGVWFGIIVASSSACIGYTYIMYKVDWANLRREIAKGSEEKDYSV